MPPLVTVGVRGETLHRELLERAFAAAEAQSSGLRVLSAYYLPTQHYDGDVLVDVVEQRPADALVEATLTSQLLVPGRAAHRSPRP